MRTVGILVLLVSSFVAAPARADAPSAACQRVVARAAGKLAKAGLKAYQHCALRTMRGALDTANCHPAKGAPTGDAGTDGAIAAALRRLSASIGAACGTSDLSAYAARCGSGPGQAFTLSSLILCLRDTHLDRASAMAAVELPQVSARPLDASTCGIGQTCSCHCSASPSGAFIGAAELF